MAESCSWVRRDRGGALRHGRGQPQARAAPLQTSERGQPQARAVPLRQGATSGAPTLRVGTNASANRSNADVNPLWPRRRAARGNEDVR